MYKYNNNNLPIWVESMTFWERMSQTMTDDCLRTSYRRKKTLLGLLYSLSKTLTQIIRAVKEKFWENCKNQCDKCGRADWKGLWKSQYNVLLNKWINLKNNKLISEYEKLRKVFFLIIPFITLFLGNNDQ